MLKHVITIILLLNANFAMANLKNCKEFELVTRFEDSRSGKKGKTRMHFKARMDSSPLTSQLFFKNGKNFRWKLDIRDGLMLTYDALTDLLHLNDLPLTTDEIDALARLRQNRLQQYDFELEPSRIGLFKTYQGELFIPFDGNTVDQFNRVSVKFSYSKCFHF